jgi:pimeloyl-ACP methyl ester carboxylesterase
MIRSDDVTEFETLAFGESGPIRQLDVRLPDGRSLCAHDTGAGSGDLAVVWHHGTPQTGALLPPLLEAAAPRRIRLVSYARPSYGGSSPNRGRTVGSAAGDVRAIADELGIDRFAVVGASGGGSHALACAALLPDRVLAAVSIAGLSPFTEAFDWFGGMASDGALRAALEGPEARTRFADTETFDEASFTAADWATLRGAWGSLGADAQRAGEAGPGGAIDDDVAYTSPWGADPAAIGVPTLLVQGGDDRVVPVGHAHRLLSLIPTAELWLRPRDGHVSVLDAVPVALDWILERRRAGR